LALEDTLEHMVWIGETTLMLDKTFFISDIIAEVRRVDRADIRQAAREIFSAKNINLSLIGPLGDAENKIRRILAL
jgi:predicted Zn-dependent peptidase